ncbi:MAG: zinc ribbon domain-containing protein [Chloroflexi bacterium]|nr:zinc ribbon domain-containing protein [Chloroflexota bacterium]
MPMYSYVCHDCGQPFEKKLRMSEAGDAQECPTCGSQHTRKSIGAVAAVGGASRSSIPLSVRPPSSPFS